LSDFPKALAGDGAHTISSEMEEIAINGLHRVQVRDQNGEMTAVTLELKCKRIHVQPPIGKQKRYPALDLTVIHATERDAPKGRKPIDWKLMTDLPARTRAEVIEKIDWYALPWKIDSFASFAVEQGESLYVLCKALGHRKASTTERYAHLRDDPVRDLVERISRHVAAARSTPDEAV
jgi:hypothetical protein